VLGQVLELSKHKFASNVVEKCVAFGTYDDRQHIIEEILAVNSDSSSPLLAMMKDGFGNYVIQKLLDVTEDEQRAQLVAKIKPQLLALKRYTYGKHLASSIPSYFSFTDKQSNVSSFYLSLGVPLRTPSLLNSPLQLLSIQTPSILRAPSCMSSPPLLSILSPLFIALKPLAFILRIDVYNHAIIYTHLFLH
jgi:Pumilio-family RNA binding repeat